MMKHDRSARPGHTSLYWAIMSRYAGIALFACLVIGFAMLIFSAVRQSDMTDQQNRTRLALAADYLSDQQAVLSEIVDQALIDISFKPIYYSRNSLYELEIIEKLSKYKGYSPLIGDVLLMYCSDTSFVYNTEHKSSTGVYLNLHFNLSDPDNFCARLRSAEEHAVFCPEDCPDTVFSVYLIRTMGKLDHSGDAWMVFCCPVAQMLQQLSRVSGIDSNQFTAIFAGSSCLYASDGTVREHNGFIATPTGTMLESNDYTVAANTAGFWKDVAFRSFCLVSLIIIVLTALMMVVFAISSARKNYKPIGDLMNRYHLPNENEISRLDDLLESLHRTNANAQHEMAGLLETLEEQKTNLREYLLLSLLGGTLQDVSSVHLARIGISAQSSLFCVLVLQLPSYTGDKAHLLGLIESVSDSDNQLLAVSICENRYFAVIACGQDPINLMSLPEVLQDVLRADNIEAVIAAGSIVRQLNDCHISMQAAIYGLCQQNAADPSLYSKDMMKSIIKEAQSGNGEQAKRQFDLLCQQITGAFPISQMRYNILSQVADDLNRTGMLWSRPDMSSAYHGALLSGDMKQYEKCCYDMITGIAEISGEAEMSGSTSDLRRKVTEFLNQHVLDESLSLDVLADECHISRRQAERIIWESFNQSYKDYVTQKRIDTAKKLLLQGKSVAETAAQVGYGNVTYFIKRFREKVGVTPGNFKDSI